MKKYAELGGVNSFIHVIRCTRTYKHLDTKMVPYQVKNMHITVGTELVSLKPMGMNVIGAAGRVDMAGR